MMCTKIEKDSRYSRRFRALLKESESGIHFFLHIYIPDVFLCSVNYHAQGSNEYDEYVDQGFFHKAGTEYCYEAVQYDKPKPDLCWAGAQICYFELAGSSKC